MRFIHRPRWLRAFPAPLNDIPYVDYPDIRIDEHESTEMPFRYVTDAHGKPVMPEVSRLRADAFAEL